MEQALILAAGQGSRLNGAEGQPKCLTPVGDETLIEYQVRNLMQLGFGRVGVVVGYRHEEVRRVLKDRVHYITNTRYATTNSLYSLWLARDWIEGGFMLLNSDVLAHPGVFRRLAAAKNDALAFDSTSGHESEHMKVYSPKGVLRSIAKHLPLEMTSGENVGMLRFSASGARKLFLAAEDLVAQGGENAWAPMAVDRLARSVPIECLNVAGLHWVEIDFPEDLIVVQERVWPRIAAGVTA